VSNCGNVASTYTYGHGDGTDFCIDETAMFVSHISMANPGYVPDISTLQVNGSYVTFPTAPDQTQTLYFTLSNNSQQEKAVFYNTCTFQHNYLLYQCFQ
jgi:hypothetical protein